MRVFLAILTTMIIAMLINLGPANAQGQEAPAYATPVCQIASEGIYNGFWVKHRIVVQGEVVFGANDMDSILSQLEVLRAEGLCR